jgi:ATP-dependent RNA helicase RhlB
MKFSELQLEPSLNTSIEKLGYTDCTPIQAEAMPLILDGKDISGLAQTGIGKTAAFVIPLMDRILKARTKMDNLSEEQKALVTKRAFQDWRAQNFILILVPTRELAEQVGENIASLGEASGIKGIAVYGGTGYDKQKEAFKNNVEFVVATPGRLIDLYKEHFIDLKQVRAVVFDEADRMFDMGFKDDMKYILSRIPQERQFLVFSATLNFDVLNTAYQFGADPVEINISKDQAKADNVKDEIFHVGHDEKPAYLLSLLKKHNPKQAIIFSNFKFNVERLAKFLSDNGVPAMGISSLLTQAQRTRVIEQFKAENEKNILVATDVAARGLDIKGVDMVINYELPQDAESYVHRIGRTGRAGTEGKAFSLVCDRDVESLSRVEDYLKNKLAVGWMESSEIATDFRPLQSEQRGPSRPYQDRPQRDARGGGQGQDRGPRRDGPRREGPRGGQGPRNDNRNDRGPRSDHKGPRSGNRPANANSAPRPGAKAHPHKKPNRNGQDANANRRPPRSQGKTSHAKPAHRQAAPPPTVMKKVSGFFKKLLGG